MSNPNLAILELVAHALGPVCDDVDIVAPALTVHDYHAIETRVRAQGFSNDMRSDAPICRWVYKNVTLDVMPTVKDILGFANHWYPLAIATAQPVTLPSGKSIKLIAAPVFIATKLEAFKDRGKDASGQPDFLGSHDLEDIITVTDRRPELIDECRAMPAELRDYLAQEFSALFDNADFETTIAGHLPGDAASQIRLGNLKTTLRSFTSL